MFLTISEKPVASFFDNETFYLSMYRGGSHHLRCRVCNYDTFREILDIFSE
jgi:hypothetical protein